MIRFLTFIATFAGFCYTVHSAGGANDKYKYYKTKIPQEYIYTRPTTKDFEFKLWRDDFPRKSLAYLKYSVKHLTEHEVDILVQHFAFGKDRIAATAVAKHYIQAVKAGDSTEYNDPKIEYPHEPITEDQISEIVKSVVEDYTNKTYNEEAVLEYLQAAGTGQLIESFVILAQYHKSDPVVAQDAARRYLKLTPADTLFDD